MAGNTYWFHRNAFKFTNQIEFQAPELCNEGECAKLLADLKMSRMDLVQSYYDYGVGREALRQKYSAFEKKKQYPIILILHFQKMFVKEKLNKMA